MQPWEDQNTAETKVKPDDDNDHKINAIRCSVKINILADDEILNPNKQIKSVYKTAVSRIADDESFKLL